MTRKQQIILLRKSKNYQRYYGVTVINTSNNSKPRYIKNYSTVIKQGKIRFIKQNPPEKMSRTDNNTLVIREIKEARPSIIPSFAIHYINNKGEYKIDPCLDENTGTRNYQNVLRRKGYYKSQIIKIIRTEYSDYYPNTEIVYQNKELIKNMYERENSK